MKREDGFNLKTIITAAGACISFIIGAGTVSGQEILQFLTSFGYWGIGGCVIALIIYVWYTETLLRVGNILNVQSSKEAYQYFLGKKLGLIYDYFTFAIVFLIFVVMIAGAGSTVTQYTGINEILGRIIIAAVVLAVVLLGLEKLVNILGTLGPAIIVFGTVIGVISFFQNIDGFKNAGKVMTTIEVEHPYGINSWWFAAILYVAFTIIPAVPFYTKVGAGVKGKRNAIAAGIIAGTAFMLVAAAFYLSMLSSIDQVYDKPIPTLVLAQNISPLFEFLFAVLILIATCSTAIPMCWTICDKVGGKNVLRYRVCAVVVCLIGFFGALFPFGKIIGFVYPSLGVLGLLLCVGMFYRRYINPGTLAKSIGQNEKK